MNMSTANLLKHAQAMPDGPGKLQLLAQLGHRPAASAPAVTSRAAGGVAAMPRHVTGRMNKTEAAYAQRLDLLKAAGEVVWWAFEPVKLRLAVPGGTGVRGVWYCVDFLVAAPDGQLWWDETKGGYITDKGKLKWRWAAEQYPALRLRMWQRVRGEPWTCVRQSDGATNNGRGDEWQGEVARTRVL